MIKSNTNLTMLIKYLSYYLLFIVISYVILSYLNTEFADNSCLYNTLPILTVKKYLNANADKLTIMAENRLRSGIYLWQNNINSNYYIGSAKDLWDRLRKYFYKEHLNRPEHKNLPILSVLKKYGHDNFSLHIVEYVEPFDKTKLLDREQYYLDLLKPYYNVLEKAGSSQGFLHSEETKELISDLKKGLYEGENNPFYGKVHSEETKQFMREFQSSREDHPFKKIGESSINYGKTHSEERNLALSKNLSGSNNPAYGHTYTTPPMKVRVFSKEDNSLIEEYSSIRKAAIGLKTSAQTIKKYSKNKELFQDKYYLTITKE